MERKYVVLYKAYDLQTKHTMIGGYLMVSLQGDIYQELVATLYDIFQPVD